MKKKDRQTERKTEAQKEQVEIKSQTQTSSVKFPVRSLLVLSFNLTGPDTHEVRTQDTMKV